MTENAHPDLAAMRRAYGQAPFDRADLAPSWHEQLERWIADAERAGVPEPNALVLATVDRAGRPSTRTVLLKGLSAEGLVFFTNYDSDKGRQLADSDHCAATLPWISLGRQVNVIGRARRVDPAVSDAYFATRPYESRLGAIASPQSQRVASRSELDDRYAELAERYPEGSEIARPDHWGGYVIAPASVEFWQGRVGRLHDRLRYTRDADEGWIIDRLAP